jgi:HEAT repeat protein
MHTSPRKPDLRDWRWGLAVVLAVAVPLLLASVPWALRGRTEMGFPAPVSAEESTEGSLVGRPAAAPLPAVLSLVRRMRSPWERQQVVAALRKLGTRARDAVPALVRLLDDPDPGLREAAASALGRCGVGVPETVPGLARALDDEDLNVRWAVDAALLEIGPDAADAVPALIRVLRDPARREWASWVLYNIGAPAVPALVDTLWSPVPDVRRSAAFALRGMGLRPALVREQCRTSCWLKLESVEGVPVRVMILRGS